MASGLDAQGQLDAAPASAQPKGDDGAEGKGEGKADGDEVARLEALLLARSGEVRALGEEIGRLRGLLRDALGKLDELGAARAEAEGAGSALARALEAETGRADAELRLDEALGKLTQLPDLVLELARLGGTARGLKGRLAEVEEARDTAEARLLLAEDDLAVEQGRHAALMLELAETSEQLDLTTARARAFEQDAQRNERELKAEIVGLQAACDDAVATIETANARATEAQRQQSEEHDRAAAAREALTHSEEARQRAETQVAQFAAAREQAEAQVVRASELLAQTRDDLQRLVGAVARAAQQGDPAADITLPGTDSPAAQGADRSQTEALSQRVREARRQLAEVQATARVAPVDAERVAKIIDLLDD